MKLNRCCCAVLTLFGVFWASLLTNYGNLKEPRYRPDFCMAQSFICLPEFCAFCNLITKSTSTGMKVQLCNLRSIRFMQIQKKMITIMIIFLYMYMRHHICGSKIVIYIYMKHISQIPWPCLRIKHEALVALHWTLQFYRCCYQPPPPSATAGVSGRRLPSISGCNIKQLNH